MTFAKVLKVSVAALWAYYMDTALGMVIPDGMTGVAPGLWGGRALVVKRVA